MRKRRDDRDERGHSLTVFVAVVVAALILMAGLVVDGGAQSAASRKAHQVAAQAARAGTDAGATARAGGREADSAEMLAAARQVLAGSGVQGTATVSGGAVEVRTRVSTDTVFLSIIGIRTLSAEADATSVLLASDRAGG
ncbi:hypothetical protein [Nigerium massiliense]|uniref:hypothetical protein n=1 Tax=Nigerium massiliense TaxID=1522317 RepID=UPI00058D6EE1|nr:hypothetical protein [Nigerium massiliense]